jgi:hypothetical protein
MIVSALMGFPDPMPTPDYHQPYSDHPPRPQERAAIDDRYLDPHVSHQR